MTKYSAKYFQNPLLQVLHSLSNGNAGTVISYKNTYQPVMDLIGITDAHAHGTDKSSGVPMVYRWIQWANKNLMRNGLTTSPGRGKWSLTSDGIVEAAKLMASTMTTTTPVTVTTPDSDKVVSVLTGPGLSETSYHDDPYIRMLAAQSTRCFGHHSEKASSCETCPIEGMCLNAVAAKMMTLADTLHQEDEAAIAAANAAIKAPKTKTKTKAAKTPIGSGKVTRAMTDQRIVARIRAVCKVCGGTINKDEEAFWVRANGKAKVSTELVGMYHINCIPE